MASDIQKSTHNTLFLTTRVNTRQTAKNNRTPSTYCVTYLLIFNASALVTKSQHYLPGNLFNSSKLHKATWPRDKPEPVQYKIETAMYNLPHWVFTTTAQVAASLPVRGIKLSFLLHSPYPFPFLSFHSPAAKRLRSARECSLPRWPLWLGLVERLSSPQWVLGRARSSNIFGTFWGES